ncbi:MAG: signal peptidase I [Planctomycetota bacterium]
MAAALGVAALVCRATIGWVYPIGSGSMEPALMTGEAVFLRYGSKVKERFDIVAFKDLGGGASIKRVFGLPGEPFMINLSGDIRFNRKYIPEAPGRPEPTPIFDSQLQGMDEHWRHGGTAFDPWTREPADEAGGSEVWTLDGSVVKFGSDLGLMRFHDRVTNGHLTPSGKYVRGPSSVHDVIVEFDVKVLSTGGSLRVLLSEQNDLFELNVSMYEVESEYRALVQRIVPSRFSDTTPGGLNMVRGGLGMERAAIPLGEWVRMRFSNIDNRISFQIGETKFQTDYRANTPRRNQVNGVQVPFSAGERVKFGGFGLAAQFRNVRVLRDFHVVPRGRFGVGTAITLGADEFFVLGDNSENSRDSRERGPISLERLIGTAQAVVLPLDDFRRL